MAQKISITRDGGVGDLTAIVDGRVEACAFRVVARHPTDPHAAPETWHIHDIRKGGLPVVVIGTIPRVRAELTKLVRGRA